MNNNEENKRDLEANTNPHQNIPLTQNGLDKGLENVRMDARLSIDRFSDEKSIQRYMDKVEDVMKQQAIETIKYKSLWMDTNTTNIDLRRQNDYLQELVKEKSESELRRHALENRQKKDEYEVNQTKEELKKALSSSFSDEINRKGGVL